MSERSVFRNLLCLKRDVREYAAEALGVIRDARAIVPLIAALRDSGLLVRRNASHSLSITKDRRAVHALLDGAKRRDGSVVAGEYEFFINRGEERTEDLLVRALDEYGSMLMAEDYLNCGNSKLESAASRWATRKGYTTKTRFD